MTLFYKAGYDIITDLCSITDNLIIFCIQIIQTGINNITGKCFFRNFKSSLSQRPKTAMRQYHCWQLTVE